MKNCSLVTTVQLLLRCWINIIISKSLKNWSCEPSWVDSIQNMKSVFVILWGILIQSETRDKTPIRKHQYGKSSKGKNHPEQYISKGKARKRKRFDQVFILRYLQTCYFSSLLNKQSIPSGGERKSNIITKAGHNWNIQVPTKKRYKNLKNLKNLNSWKLLPNVIISNVLKLKSDSPTSVRESNFNCL